MEQSGRRPNTVTDVLADIEDWHRKDAKPVIHQIQEMMKRIIHLHGKLKEVSSIYDAYVDSRRRDTQSEKNVDALTFWAEGLDVVYDLLRGLQIEPQTLRAIQLDGLLPQWQNSESIEIVREISQIYTKGKDTTKKLANTDFCRMFNNEVGKMSRLLLEESKRLAESKETFLGDFVTSHSSPKWKDHMDYLRKMNNFYDELTELVKKWHGEVHKLTDVDHQLEEHIFKLSDIERGRKEKKLSSLLETVKEIQHVLMLLDYQSDRDQWIRKKLCNLVSDMGKKTDNLKDSEFLALKEDKQIQDSEKQPLRRKEGHIIPYPETLQELTELFTELQQVTEIVKTSEEEYDKRSLLRNEGKEVEKKTVTGIFGKIDPLFRDLDLVKVKGKSTLTKLTDALSQLQDDVLIRNRAEEKRRENQLSPITEMVEALDKLLMELKNSSNLMIRREIMKSIFRTKSDLEDKMEEMKESELLVLEGEIGDGETGHYPKSQNEEGIINQNEIFDEADRMFNNLYQALSQMKMNETATMLSETSSKLQIKVKTIKQEEGERREKQLSSLIEMARKLSQTLVELHHESTLSLRIEKKKKINSMTLELEDMVEELEASELFSLEEIEAKESRRLRKRQSEDGIIPFVETVDELIRLFDKLRQTTKQMKWNETAMKLSETSLKVQNKVQTMKGLEKIRTTFISEIKEKYEKIYDAVKPLPFVQDKLYSVEGLFVEGKIEMYNSKWVKLDSYRNIFDNCIQSSRRVVIGDPGYGKSTIALQAVYDWCKGVKESPLKDVEVLIFLRLRQMTNNMEVVTAIKRFVLPRHTRLTETDVKNVVINSKSLLILFDGFDEYPDQESVRACTAEGKPELLHITLGNMLGEIKVVVTSRYLPQHFPSDRTKIRLRGFDEKSRDRYIERAVVGVDKVAAQKIKMAMETNLIFHDLCEVPLLFVMFAHMSKNEEEVQTFGSVTTFFEYVIKCMHSHMKNKMSDENVQSYYLYEEDHEYLDEIAFKGLIDRQKIWTREDFRENLGEDCFNQYRSIGILVEDFDESYDATLRPREIRFYHTIFQEWFAAFYLARFAKARDFKSLQALLKNMPPFDLQYLYRFSCGLGDDLAADNIIQYLSSVEGGNVFATLCVLEKRSTSTGDLSTIEKICAEEFQFDDNQSSILQRSFIQLLSIASTSKIRISKVAIVNCLTSRDFVEGKLCLKSGVQLSGLTSLEELQITEGREITKQELENILHYCTLCDNLRLLSLIKCSLPRVISGGDLPKPSRNVRIMWCNEKNNWYVVNVIRGSWRLHLRTAGRNDMPFT